MPSLHRCARGEASIGVHEEMPSVVGVCNGGMPSSLICVMNEDRGAGARFKPGHYGPPVRGRRPWIKPWFGSRLGFTFCWAMNADGFSARLIDGLIPFVRRCLLK